MKYPFSTIGNQPVNGSPPNRERKLRTRGIGVGALLLLLLYPLASEAMEEVRLQLKWKHQFQFAGYYAAQEQGYYRAAGLDVEIIPSRLDEDAVQQVLQGKAEFGVGTTDLLLLREQGQPVVVLATIFQHSPLALMMIKRDGIQSVHDLADQKVMIEPGAAELYAYLRREGVSPETFALLPHSLHTEDLLSGAVDAMSIYVTDEPFELRAVGQEYLLYSPRSVGIDFYGDNLFTTEQQLKQNPERVRAFREASLKGWVYAMENPEEMVQLIHTQYSQRHSIEHLRFEADQMEPLLRASLVEIGHMNPGRWQHIAETYAVLGLMEPDFDLKGFLYDPNPPPPDLLWVSVFMGLASLAVICVLAVALFIYRANVRLHREGKERKLSEEMLERSEALHRTLFVGAAEGILVADPETRKFRHANPAICELLGYTAEELTGMDVGKIHPEESLPAVFAAFEAQARGEIRLAAELPCLRKNGEIIYADINTARVELDGKPLLVGFFSDVTERRLTAEALRASESRYRLLMQHATDVIWVIDAESQICLYISPSVERMLGFTDKELIGQNVAKAVTPVSLEHIEATTPVRIEQMMRGDAGTFTDEVEMIHKAGHTVWTEMNMRFVLNTDTSRVEGTGVMRDITERKQASEELRQTHQVLESILSAIPVRVFWKDRNLVYLGCNRAFARDAGFAEPKDIVGKDDLQMGWSEEAELYRADDRDVIESGRPRLLIEEPQTTPAGDKIWLLTSKVPLCDSAGKIAGVLGTYMDVTENKRMQEEQQTLTERLLKEQKLAAVGTLACGMGHEINNPIMGIINYAQLIKDRLQGKDANVEEFADEIAIEAERIAGIVRSLSAFATRDAAVRVSIPVSDLIESALAPLREPLTHSQIALEVDVPDNLPSVVCDRGQLAQVLTSLLNNARDALNEKYPEHDYDKVILVNAEGGRKMGTPKPKRGRRNWQGAFCCGTPHSAIRNPHFC